MRKFKIHRKELQSLAYKMDIDLNDWDTTEFILFKVIPKARELRIQPVWGYSIYSDIFEKALSPEDYTRRLISQVLEKLNQRPIEIDLQK